MVVGLGAAELVQSLGEKFSGLQLREAGQRRHLIEAALKRAFRGGAVVADDQVDQGVVENAEVLERVDQEPDMMIGVFEEAGVNFHLARKHRLHRRGDGVPGRDLGMARSELTILGDHPEFLLARESFLAQLVPALVEFALVLVGPFLREHGGARASRPARNK